MFKLTIIKIITENIYYVKDDIYLLWWFGVGIRILRNLLGIDDSQLKIYTKWTANSRLNKSTCDSHLSFFWFWYISKHFEIRDAVEMILNFFQVFYFCWGDLTITQVQLIELYCSFFKEFIFYSWMSFCLVNCVGIR